MKQVTNSRGVIIMVALVLFYANASFGIALDGGDVKVIYEFGQGETPEGIAVDGDGNLLVGLRKVQDSTIVQNEIIRISGDGERKVVADLGPAALDWNGVLGLNTDPSENIYLAFASGNDRHGVWKISPDGKKERLAGSDKIVFPNAIALDGQGNVYVTDSDPMNNGETGVWRYTLETGKFKPWCGNPLLLSDPANPCGGMPLVAANGITFVSPNHIYVANTERGLVAHIQVRDDGSAGKVSMVAGNTPLLLNPDGLIADEKGNLYTVVPVATVDMPTEMGGPLPPMSPLVRIITETGMIEPLLDIHSFPDTEYFDFPTSLILWNGKKDRKIIYVINMGSRNYGFPPGTGAKITRVQVY